METLTRAEIPESDKWDLAQLFADVGKWREVFPWVKNSYPRRKGGKIFPGVKTVNRETRGGRGKAASRPRISLSVWNSRRNSMLNWNGFITSLHFSSLRTARIRRPSAAPAGFKT